MDAGDRDDVQADPSSGVFGNLPGSRPGTRSPRRGSSEPPASDPTPADEAAAAAPTEPPSEAPKPGPEPQASPRPQDERRTSEPAGPEATPRDFDSETEQGGGGLEDLAWAGIAAAAEAATLGVRLATRAIEAVRESVDRR